MRTGEPFDLTFYQCDLKKKTAGKRVDLFNAVMRPVPRTIKNKNIININTIEGLDHNVFVHIYLMTRFNGKKITLR